MKRAFFGLILLLTLSCKQESTPKLTVQEIVDKAIEASGGLMYKTHGTSFMFRDRKYISQRKEGKKVLQRITYLDSVTIKDVKTNSGLTRYFNDTIVAIPDSIAFKYANSVNSVHYFARLPYGLNDKAVNKELLGEETLKDVAYYKVKITFDQEGGGKDFDDTYVYWFNKTTFKPDYLAYDYHTDGGGQRFREAYNERYVGGIRFVDYNNYKSKDKGTKLLEIGKLFEKGELALLSQIELSEIEVVKN
ncbi:DUF6503 family protein [Flagellimonas myxillae]|uniref:DUF6503 family protein n=1 Tax=Flagellimonas myxillae TaxID=2942214 RepID=UPI00201EAEAD|nr:DUF6503 family protein [Muricauda myxillae]MCL6265687.1 deoxyribose-phosphate aldolase [Muricauda myxillae]